MHPDGDEICLTPREAALAACTARQTAIRARRKKLNDESYALMKEGLALAEDEKALKLGEQFTNATNEVIWVLDDRVVRRG